MFRPLKRSAFKGPAQRTGVREDPDCGKPVPGGAKSSVVGGFQQHPCSILTKKMSCRVRPPLEPQIPKPIHACVRDGRGRDASLLSPGPAVEDSCDRCE